MSDIFQRLSAPFPPEQISWRVGSTSTDKTKGLALAYLDARDVMERLDNTVGPENWQCRYPHANGKTVCEIGIKVDGEWIWKADGSGDTDVEAEKGALSDAFKRAAVRWGIGRYLYDLGNIWAEIEPVGRSYKIKDGEYAKLRSRLTNVRNSAPVEARSDDAKAYVALAKTAMRNASTVAELEDWWRSEAGNRREYSVVTGTPAFDDLAAAFKETKKALLPKLEAAE